MQTIALNIFGVVPADDAFNKMKAVYDACINAGVQIPPEVEALFGYSEPSANGFEDYLSEPIVRVLENGSAGIELEVDLSLLPSKYKFLRFEVMTDDI